MKLRKRMRWPLRLRRCTQLSSVREDCYSIGSRPNPNASTGQRTAQSSNMCEDISFESKSSPNASTGQRRNEKSQQPIRPDNGARTISSFCSSIDALPDAVDVSQCSSDDDDMSMLSFASTAETAGKKKSIATTPLRRWRYNGKRASSNLTGLNPGSAIDNEIDNDINKSLSDYSKGSRFSNNNQNDDEISMKSSETYSYSLNGVGSLAKYSY